MELERGRRGPEPKSLYEGNKRQEHRAEVRMRDLWASKRIILSNLLYLDDPGVLAVSKGSTQARCWDEGPYDMKGLKRM